MRLTVASKLFLTVLLVSLMVISVVVAVIGWNLRQGFTVYVTQATLTRQTPLINRLERIYLLDGNWRSLERSPERWQSLVEDNVLASALGDRSSWWQWTLLGIKQASAAPPEAPPRLDFDFERNRPPREAFDDCRGKKLGDRIKHKTPDGSIAATCVDSPDGLVARPDQPPNDRPPNSAAVEPEQRTTRTKPGAQDIQSAPQLTAMAVLTLPQRFTLFDAQNQYIAGRVSAVNDHLVKRNLKGANGEIIGSLGLLVPSQTVGQDQTFIEYGVQVLIIAALCALTMSMLAAWLLSRSFLGIVRHLAHGAQQLTSGRFDIRLKSKRKDEFGDLINDFNRLAATLEKHEQSRRLWVAQTSHELRTPISVLRAHVEALIDGVRNSTPAELELLHREVMRIGKLVTDLNELSRADSGALAFKKEPVELLSIIEEMVSAYQERCATRSLTLSFQRVGRIMLFADQDRLRQLFLNLFENSLRYTDAPGAISISYLVHDETAILVFEDSAPSVNASIMAELFDPFYRTDESRQRETGGSGLGLAIVRAIVVAHDGTIKASVGHLGGLAITITLPMLGVQYARA